MFNSLKWFFTSKSKHPFPDSPRFRLNEWYLLPERINWLENLVRFLNLNPDKNIELNIPLKTVSELEETSQTAISFNKAIDYLISSEINTKNLIINRNSSSTIPTFRIQYNSKT